MCEIDAEARRSGYCVDEQSNIVQVAHHHIKQFVDMCQPTKADPHLQHKACVAASVTPTIVYTPPLQNSCDSPASVSVNSLLQFLWQVDQLQASKPR